jgi:hypothetical protein
MPVKIDAELREAFSRGEISRREIQDRLDAAVSFGALLAALHERGLPLPRVPSDPNAAGVQLIIGKLAERARRA